MVITVFNLVWCRESVSSHLYQLVVEECNLMAELRLVLDVFTMTRGELFHAWIQMADSRLRSPVTGATQHDTNQVKKWIKDHTRIGNKYQ